MAYEKQTWHNGDTITEQKLNHMEDGIANAGGGGVFTIIANMGSDHPTLNQKAKDIYDAFVSVSCIIKEIDEGKETIYPLSSVTTDGTHYAFGYYISLNGTIQETGFVAGSPDDYPVLVQS